MAQLIACKFREGIVMGADSKAVDVDAGGNLIELKVDRLHALSQHTAIMNGGAVAGEAMCHALKNFVADENLNYIDEIHQAALPFLATEYDRFMRKTCETQPIDPIHQVTFILGGYTYKDEQDPFRLYLLWTKRKLPGTMLDASGGGCRVEVSEKVAPSELIRVILHTHETSTHLALGGEVRWHSVTSAGAHLIGVKFSGTTAMLAGKLLGFASTGMT